MFNTIQWSTTSIPATDNDITVNLNFPVDVDKSFAILEVTNITNQTSYVTKAGDYLCVPQLTTVVDNKYTQIYLKRHWITLGGMQINVKWTVVELINGSVETGITNITGVNMEVGITNYTDEKTFTLAYPWSSDFLWGLDFNDQHIMHKCYNNGANDVIQLKTLAGSYIDSVYWQSIYILESSVQIEEFSCGSVQTFDHTNSKAVDMDNTFIIGSALQNIAFHDSNMIKAFRMISTTQVRTYSNAVAIADFYIYIISHPSISVVERSLVTYDTQSISFAIATPVDPEKAIVILGHQSQHWGIVNSDVYFYGSMGNRSTLQTLVNGKYTELLLNRGATSGTDVTVFYEILELYLGIIEEDEIIDDISNYHIKKSKFNSGIIIGI